MSEKTLSMKAIDFRLAKASDAKLAGRLLFESFPRKASCLIGLGNEDRARKILSEIFVLPGHRLSYKFASIAMIEGRTEGLVIAFPGKMLNKLNRHLVKHILRHYSFRGKLAFIFRLWPLVFLKESARDEFFLANLAVRNKHRGQGVVEALLMHVETLAKQSGFLKIALVVDIDNQDAKEIYGQNGYSIKAINLESNARIPYLGPGYQRRVKEMSL
ncbi:MAG: GNAT family N-acetyltransferase [Brevefilum sp.]|nr:GNAT family N-acetyltransferase [Brevefilum sp.]